MSSRWTHLRPYAGKVKFSLVKKKKIGGPEMNIPKLSAVLLHASKEANVKPAGEVFSLRVLSTSVSQLPSTLKHFVVMDVGKRST